MAKKLYVGNLSWSTTEDELKNYFASVGEVSSATIISDRDTGRSRGFGFVEMENADDAIAQFHGKEFGGRQLVVNEAQEKKREDRGPRNYGRNQGGYGRY